MANYGRTDLVKLKAFHTVFNELIGINGFNIEHDKRLEESLTAFKKALGMCIYESSNPEIAKHKGTIGLKTFWAIFKKYYLIEYSREYTLPVSPAEAKIIKDMIYKIELNKSSVEEYLKWFWEEHKPNNEWMYKSGPVFISSIITLKMFERFLQYLTDIRNEKKGLFEESIKNDLLSRMRTIIRTLNEDLSGWASRLGKEKVSEIVMKAQNFNKNIETLKTGELRSFVEECEKIITENKKQSA